MIRKSDISKSVQRFQLTIDEVKVQHGLAVSPGTWLMPSPFFSEHSARFNNSLKKATAEMKLGVNKSMEMKSVGERHMNAHTFGQAAERQAPEGHLSPFK